IFRGVFEFAREENEVAVRRRLEKNKVLVPLKAWAIQRLNGNPVIDLAMEDLPPEIRSEIEKFRIQHIKMQRTPKVVDLAASFASSVALLSSPSGNGPMLAATSLYPGKTFAVRYLEVIFSAGLRNYGLFIGPAGFRPNNVPWNLSHWDDEIWYYDDRPLH